MPRTRIEKLWLGGAAVVGLLIAIVGYFFLVSPQRARTADVQDQVSSAQLQTTTLESRISSLTSQQKKAASYRLALAQARAALPTLDDLSATPSLLRSLQAIARASSTSVSSLTVGDPTAVTPPTTTVASDTPSASPSASPSATASGTGTAGTAGAAPAGLYSVAVTSSVTGSSSALTNFLARLQHDQPRAVLISAVSITDATTGRHGAMSMSLTMTAFVRPSAATASSAAPSTSSTP